MYSHESPTDPIYEQPATDEEARAEAILTLADLVKSSFDPRDVDRWVRAAPIRQDISQDLVAGRIRWPRALGRPNAPQLSAAFVIEPQFWLDVWHLTPEGVVQDLRGWFPGEAPDLRDGMSEPDYYSVRYLFHASEVGAVKIRFSEVAWYRPGRATPPQTVFLSSHGFTFGGHDRFLILPDVIVSAEPFVSP